MMTKKAKHSSKKKSCMFPSVTGHGGPLLKVKLLVGYVSACRACCTVTDRRTGIRPAQIGVKKWNENVYWDCIQL